MNAVAARTFGGEACSFMAGDAAGVGSMRVSALVIERIIKGGVAPPALPELLTMGPVEQAERTELMQAELVVHQGLRMTELQEPME